MSIKVLRNRLFRSRHERRAIQTLRELERQLPAPHTRLAIPFLFRGRGLFRSIRPMQSQLEIGELYQVVLARKPRTIVEIGTCHGGTLYLWCQAAAPDALIISIDLPEGEFGGGYPSCRAALYRAFATPAQRLHLLRADSHSRDTARQVEEILGDRRVDFLFIDGDHTYSGVKADFDLYTRFVANGGLVALHDIALREDEPRIEVWKFWREIKEHQPDAIELLDNTPTGRRIGIGVLPVRP